MEQEFGFLKEMYTYIYIYIICDHFFSLFAYVDYSAGSRHRQQNTSVWKEVNRKDGQGKRSWNRKKCLNIQGSGG